MKHWIKILSVTFVILFSLSVVSFARDVSYEEALAGELKELGIFKGVTDTDFDLDRAPSRVEALVMLVRILGVENEVHNGVWKHPFTDVPSWADNYVGYAYSKGLTNGQSTTEFGTGDASAAIYLTFVLRALGYSDANGLDFSWNDPYTLANENGILPEKVNVSEFWRADVVLVSHAALSAYLKGADMTLAEKLMQSGVFTSGKFKNVYGKAYATSAKVLSSEQIYSSCSSAVFFILGMNEEYVVTGSGFFINDMGVAITNYHVLDGLHVAAVQTTDEETYNILGVYAYSKEQDWAVIQVDCKGNDYLRIGDALTIVGGAPIYAIGSPEGLQNTISQGIISNVSRYNAENGVNYIQITAPISHGSSGGALINKYGEVIGITTAGHSEGQNLNLAVPVHIVDTGHDGEPVSLYDINQNEIEMLPVTSLRTLRPEEAFEALKTYVENIYNDTLNDGKECYYKYVEHDDGFMDIYVYYDEEFDDITINLMYFYDSYCFDYYMSINTRYIDSCLASLSLFEIDDNESVRSVADGLAQIDKESFNGNTSISFYEFEGENMKVCEQVGGILHKASLLIVDELLSQYAQKVSAELYSVYDFGYISF